MAIMQRWVARFGWAYAVSGATCAVAATTLYFFSIGAAVVAAGPLDASAAAEVTKLERDIERFFNSPEFARNPAAGLVYYDKSDKMMQFDIMQPGEFKGPAFQSHFIDVGKQFEGGKVEFYDLEVVADKQLAFATMKQHFAGKAKDGSPFDMTMRVTDCLRREAGHWIIVHEHVSLPLDIATFMSVIKPVK